MTTPAQPVISAGLLEQCLRTLHHATPDRPSFELLKDIQGDLGGLYSALEIAFAEGARTVQHNLIREIACNTDGDPVDGDTELPVSEIVRLINASTTPAQPGTAEDLATRQAWLEYPKTHPGPLNSWLRTPAKTRHALLGIITERRRQTAKFGQQSYPDGTSTLNTELADLARALVDRLEETGEKTWAAVALEEFLETLAETGPANIRKEALELAAVCVAWAEDIDSRPVSAPSTEAS